MLSKTVVDRIALRKWADAITLIRAILTFHCIYIKLLLSFLLKLSEHVKETSTSLVTVVPDCLRSVSAPWTETLRFGRDDIEHCFVLLANGLWLIMWVRNSFTKVNIDQFLDLNLQISVDWLRNPNYVYITCW